jgi:hypothetical protein
MNYQSINGLRLLAVELGLLGGFWTLAFLVMRFLCPSFRCTRPRWLDWLLVDNRRSVLVVILLALVARALLLPIVGIPEPRVNDEYSYLLMADTFTHGRVTNPTPPAWQYFETFHVNMTPTYHSMYPVAQGLVLAFGQMMFHQPWIGVYLSTALLCGAICWALQAFVPPVWALIGGVLAIARIATFGYWMNSYWGGSVAALGGAAALGAVVRLFDRNLTDRGRTKLACIFVTALLILATSRPYEGLAFSLPLLGYFAYQTLRGGAAGAHFRTILVPVVGIGTLGMVMMGFYNHQTTGNALEMPYVLNHRTYWPLPFFLGEGGSPDLKLADPVFAKFMKITAEEYGYQNTKALSGLLTLEGERFMLNWFFYVGPALSFPVALGFLLSLTRPRLRLATYAAVATAAGAAMCVFSQLHYFSPATIAVYIFAVEGLQYLWQEQHTGERTFAIAVFLTVLVASLGKQTGSSAMNTTFAFSNARTLVAEPLAAKPGKHLVLVTYDLERHYPGNELVHNGAEFGSEKILWARSKGPGNDRDLCQAYPERTFWSLTTDDVKVTLGPLDVCK